MIWTFSHLHPLVRAGNAHVLLRYIRQKNKKTKSTKNHKSIFDYQKNTCRTQVHQASYLETFFGKQFRKLERRRCPTLWHICKKHRSCSLQQLITIVERIYSISSSFCFWKKKKTAKESAAEQIAMCHLQSLEN